MVNGGVVIILCNGLVSWCGKSWNCCLKIHYQICLKDNQCNICCCSGSREHQTYRFSLFRDRVFGVRGKHVVCVVGALGMFFSIVTTLSGIMT